MAQIVAGPHGRRHRTAGPLAQRPVVPAGVRLLSGASFPDVPAPHGTSSLPTASRGTFLTRFRVTALWESLSSPWPWPANGKSRLQGQPVALVGKRFPRTQSLLDASPPHGVADPTQLCRLVSPLPRSSEASRTQGHLSPGGLSQRAVTPLAPSTTFFASEEAPRWPYPRGLWTCVLRRVWLYSSMSFPPAVPKSEGPEFRGLDSEEPFAALSTVTRPEHGTLRLGCPF